MNNKTTQRVIARITFPNMRDAYEAADRLEEAGYEVAISQEALWLASGAAFMEAYKDVNGNVPLYQYASDGRARLRLREIMNEIKLTTEPFRGFCVSTYPIDPNHVPFAYVAEWEEEDIVSSLELFGP
jgi:hypothetical protein